MLQHVTKSQISQRFRASNQGPLFDQLVCGMLEIKRFDGGRQGRQAALLSSVEDGIDRRTRDVRRHSSDWYPDCSRDGEPMGVREVSALAAWQAPTHDREEVAVHA